MTFAPGDLHHTGYLVEDLDSSLEQLRRLGYHHWTPSKDHALRIRVDGTEQTARFRYVYSAEGPHHLELIQPLDDGYLRTTGPMTFHHLGFWVEDLENEIATAADRGLTLDCLFLDPDGAAKVAYFTDGAGMRYETVPRAIQADLEERWNQALDRV